jgi:hypothetical protein
MLPQQVLPIGFRTLVLINTSHLILQIWQGPNHISVMVRDFPYLLLGIIKYIHHIILSLCLMFMFHILRNLCFLFRNFILITMFILNFTYFFYVKDLNTKVVLLSSQSIDGLYALTRSLVMSVPQAYWSPCMYAFVDLWHRRLGHPTSCIFKFLVSQNKITCNNKRLNFQSQIVH